MYILHDRVASLSLMLIKRFKEITPSALGHLIGDGAINNLIRPVQAGATLLGTAVTVQTMGRDSIVCHKVMDYLQPGDIVVVSRNGDQRYACWGEMTTLAARLSGAAGVLIDGPVTDIQVLRQDPLPIFCQGTSVLTTHFLGTGGSINLPVVCGGIVVNPGDLIFGDENGVFVIPPSDAEKLLMMALAEEKEDAEWRQGLLAGKRPSQLAPLDKLMNIEK